MEKEVKVVEEVTNEVANTGLSAKAKGLIIAGIFLTGGLVAFGCLVAKKLKAKKLGTAKGVAEEENPEEHE